MGRSVISILVILLLPMCSYAQKTVKVTSEYTYVAPENITLEQAKLTAVDRAKIQAIADEFGTLVTQSNTTYVSNTNGDSSIDFLSLGGSDVKGEWIETIGEPEITPSYEQGMLVIKVKISGRIREIKSSKVDLLAQVLCNGTTPQHERSEFMNGDDMFLRFQSPVDGYLVIYLLDYTAQTAYCLLPYSQSSDAAQKIEHDRSYIFFSSKDAPTELKNIVDEYTLTCSSSIERNDIYVLFSPNEFNKSNTIQTSDTLPREISYQEFIKWLSEIRKRNNNIQITNKSLTIKN